jgi:hypothetical protein
MRIRTAEMEWKHRYDAHYWSLWTEIPISAYDTRFVFESLQVIAIWITRTYAHVRPQLRNFSEQYESSTLTVGGGGDLFFFSIKRLSLTRGLTSTETKWADWRTYQYKYPPLTTQPYRCHLIYTIDKSTNSTTILNDQHLTHDLHVL